MSGKLAQLKFDDPLFPLQLSEISESRLLQDAQQDELRTLLGYDRPEHEQPDIPIEDAVGSFSGIIYKTAAIAQSGANERKADVLSILRGIEAAPARLHQQPGPSQEVIGRIAVHYQREGERPGVYWWDISEGGAKEDRVEAAARRAADELEGETGVRRKNLSFAYLTLALRREYKSFGLEVTRAFDPMQEIPQPVSRFSRFADLICGDWIEFIRREKLPIPTGTDRMARNALDQEWVDMNSLMFPELCGYRI